MKRFFLSKCLVLAAILLGWNVSSFAQTVTFSYTGGMQSYTVPNGVTAIIVDAQGAAGGIAGPTSSLGVTTATGLGGRVQGTLTVTPGQVLNIFVGQQGALGTPAGVSGGYNGGGNAASWGGTYSGGGGGGASDIRVGGAALSNRVIVAGGGGGGGYNGQHYGGGAGGNLIGATGATDVNGTGGTGGTQVGGGIGGGYPTYTYGSNGTLGNGGSSQLPSPGIGGGGGGGYYGGGGGGWSGGGGGSSYTDPLTVSSPVLSQGFQSGDGVVILCPVPFGGAITGPGAVCPGSTITLSNPTATSGGTWSSSNTGVATVGLSTGIVTGVSAGNATITYTITNACGTASATTAITVNPLPSAIAGADNVCQGSVTTLTDPTSGGTWSSSNTGIATVGSASGDVTGVAIGNVNIIYTVTATGCSISHLVHVFGLPFISGGSNVAICNGNSTTLSATGGDAYSWSPSTGLSATTGVSVVASPTVTTTYTVTGTATPSTIVYNQAFVAETIPTTQCTAWDAFRASLLGTYNYTGFTMRGSNNTTGITCTDPAVATAIANALRTGTSYTGTSDGQTWYVGVGCTSGPCGAIAVELSNQGTCSCALGYSIRPSINNANWGGIDGVTCEAASQTMEVDFFINTGCANSATVTVTVNPLPTQFTVFGGGAYCSGGSGVHVGLSGSEGDFEYQVYRNDTAIGGIVSGTGDSLDFGLFTLPGIYTVWSTNPSTECTSLMMSSATVSINPLPIAYTVTGGGSYCAGGTGRHIGLDLSNGGIRYQLYHGVDTTGLPVNGTDTAIDFGLRTAAGTYTVVATDTTTGCMRTMMGSATITITPLVFPTVTITKSTPDTICAGTPVTFSAFATDGGESPVFIWKVNGTTVGIDSNGYGYVPTDGNMVTVLLVSDMPCPVPDTASSDTLRMNVLPNGTPTVHLSATPGDSVCIGADVTINAATTFGGYSPTYTWIKNTVIVSTAATYSFTPVNGDQVYMVMNSNYMCRLATVAYSNVVNMMVEDPIIPYVTIAGRPGMLIGPGKPDTLTATIFDGGTAPSYQWYINNAPVPGATSSVFIRTSYNNGDSVSCKVTRNDACKMSSINSVVIHVGNVGVQNVNANADLKLIPNPNKGSFVIKGSLGTGLDEEVAVEITDMLGQVVYKNNVKAIAGNIDQPVQLENVANGMYMLTLHAANGVTTFRFVTEK